MVMATTIDTFLTNTVDPSKHSAAYKIFHYEWDVSVPHMYVYTDEYMRISGVVETEDPIYNRNLPRQFIGGRYTIAQMAVLFDEGATIRVEVPEDVKKIYDIVRQHLADWSAHLTATSSFDNKKIPEHDLMRLSSFADSLYVHATRFHTIDKPTGRLMQRFEALRGKKTQGQGRRFVDPNAPVDDKNNAPKPMAGHKGFADDILTKSQERTPWS